MGVYHWIGYRWIVTDDICLPCVAQVQLQKPTKLLILFLTCGLCVGANLFIMSFANMYDHLKLHVVLLHLLCSNLVLFGLFCHTSHYLGKTNQVKKSGYTQS